MALSISLSSVFRPIPRLNPVAVSAKKNRGSSDGSSWKKKRSRKKFSPPHDKSGDISVLYSDNVVAKDTLQLKKDCTKRISDYIEDGNLSAAQEVFDLMIEKGLKPDVYTYTALMKGYSRVGDTEKVSELFAEMEEKGLEPSVVTFNTAIGSYAIDGDLEGAQSFFKRLKDNDRLDPDVYTYSSMLSVCVTARDLETARKIFNKTMSSGVEVNNIVLSSIIDVHAECCNEENGRHYLEECRELMKDVEERGIQPNEHAYSTLLKVCARGELTADALKTLKEMKDNGVLPNVFSYCIVLDGISKDRNLSNEEIPRLASKIVNEMKNEEIRMNAMSYTSLINVALRVRDLNRADHLLQEMKELKVHPDYVTYGAMIKCYEKLGDPSNGLDYLKPCLDLWQECEEAGMFLNEDGYTSLLSACAKAFDGDQALRIWNKMISHKLKPNVSTYSAMINVFVSVGNRDKAIMLFREMKEEGILPNPVTYGVMIKCYQKFGDPRDREVYLTPCLRLLEECEQAGMNLSVEGYTSLLSACEKASDFDQALSIWHKMKQSKVKPDVSAFNSMIKMCLRKDNRVRAYSFLDQMKASESRPDSVTYRTFVSYYSKMNDKSGAKKIWSKMKKLGVEPSKVTMRMLKALEVQ